MFLICSCSCLCPIYWSHVLSWEWRCSWCSADRRCSNYIWVINNLIAHKGVTYIRDLKVLAVVHFELFIGKSFRYSMAVKLKFYLTYFSCLSQYCFNCQLNLPQGTNFSDIKNTLFSFDKMHLNILSVKMSMRLSIRLHHVNPWCPISRDADAYGLKESFPSEKTWYQHAIMCLTESCHLIRWHATHERITLTHWPLGDVAVVVKVSFSNVLYRLLAWILTVKLLSSKCHRTALM